MDIEGPFFGNHLEMVNGEEAVLQLVFAKGGLFTACAWRKASGDLRRRVFVLWPEARSEKQWNGARMAAAQVLQTIGMSEGNGVIVVESEEKERLEEWESEIARCVEGKQVTWIGSLAKLKSVL